MTVKTIGIIGNLSCYGGVQTCIISLIKALNRKGITPLLITNVTVNSKIIREQQLKLEVLHHEYSLSWSKYQKWKFLRGFRELIYFFKTSWIQQPLDFMYVFVPGIINDAKIPCLYYTSMTSRSPMSLNPGKLNKLKLFLYDHLTKYWAPVYDIQPHNQYVINSHYTAELFHEVYKARIPVVFPPVSFQAGSLTKPAPVSVNKVVFFSRIIPEKRPELFIQLAKQHPTLEFSLVGSYDSMEYVNSLKRSCAEDSINNVYWHIDTPRIQMETILEESDVYVFPAKNEHFGITTVEAIFKGVIPFVHDSGGQREIVPVEHLRFNDQNFLMKFNELVKCNATQLKQYQFDVFNNSNKFQEQHFQQALIKYLALPQ